MERLKLPYVPFFSFGEKLAVIEQGTGDPSSLGAAYENLALLLATRLDSVELLSEDRGTLMRRAQKAPAAIGKHPVVFISYSHGDRQIKDRLRKHLKVLPIEDLIEDSWDDRSIQAGDDWFLEVKKSLDRATVAILLVSVDFLNSPFTFSEELPMLLERRKAEGLRIYPILIGHCPWQRVPWLSKLQVRSWDGGPLPKGKAGDQALAAIAAEIADLRAPSAAEPHVSVAKLPTVSALLIGRGEELKQLDAAWGDQGRPNPTIRLVSIVAFGGVGKTSLAINWWHRNGAPGALRILGWSFYSQGSAEDRQGSTDAFLLHGLREWFGVFDPPKDSWQRGQRLAELIRRERTLLILDGLEPIQFPPGPQFGRLKDLGMVALLKELAAHNPGLCICTSRLPLTDLEDYGNAGVLSIDLDNLTPESGGQYLAALRVQGYDTELRQASVEFDSHALALTLLGNYLVKRRGGDIRKRDTIPPLVEYDASKGGHARRILSQYEALFKGKPELSVLRTLGLFDRPADAGALRVLRESAVLVNLSADDWATALENLKDARLIQYSDPKGLLDSHPLVREHFANELRAADPEAFREAHSRLYEHYSKQAPYQPDTLEEMTPLFNAVYHGCQAGRYTRTCDDVYLERILRGDALFLERRLGAFGADLSLLANFFASPWTEPVSELSSTNQAWIVAQAGFALRATGRLAEAVEPTRGSAEAASKAAFWTNAAAGFSNLSELYLALGDIHEAIGAARRSVGFADQSGEIFQKLASRTALADAIHQSGDVAQAASLFEEAEGIQTELQPESPSPNTQSGYLYRDLLLAQGQPYKVVRRSLQVLEWAKQYRFLLDIALDHLSLGCVYAAGSDEAAQHLDEAVNGLRLAGQLDNLPRGLLARAMRFRSTGDFPNAQKDLDEVRILANRCGMRLHLTDYHLEQARLFLAQGQAGDARPHYEAAKKLIEETGYHRRDSELAELAAPIA